MADYQSELESLNQYHQTVASKDYEGQASLLRNGFLPETPEALLEAGIRCMPLIESGATELSEAAIDRLAAIQFKLKMLPETAVVRKALDEVEARLLA